MVLMPGRLTLTASAEELKKRFAIKIPAEYKPRYNISPTQKILVLFDDGAVMASWGVKTPWLKQPIINARSENIEQNRVFSKDFVQRRCLVIADSYYEWQETQEGKIPHRIMLADKSIFCIAGVWKEIEGQRCFATITVEPSSFIRTLHHRMPAILPRNLEQKWLQNADKKLLQTYTEKMLYYQVSTDVNSSRHDKKEYILPQGKEVIG